MKKILMNILMFLAEWGISKELNYLLRTDVQGNATKGSAHKVLSEIRLGSSVRVAWIEKDSEDEEERIEHWVSASNVTIMNGHVFVQITSSYKQILKEGIPQVDIENTNTKWTGVIGTNGTLVSRYIIDQSNNGKDAGDNAALENRTQVIERKVNTIWMKT